MGFEWEVRPEDVFPGALEDYTQALYASGRRQGAQRAEDIEKWMKTNAPWRDRTGMARKNLSCVNLPRERLYADLILSHGVPYGIWLEIANAGRYAIISRAVDYWGPILMKDVQRIMNLTGIEP